MDRDSCTSYTELGTTLTDAQNARLMELADVLGVTKERAFEIAVEQTLEARMNKGVRSSNNNVHLLKK